MNKSDAKPAGMAENRDLLRLVRYAIGHPDLQAHLKDDGTVGLSHVGGERTFAASALRQACTTGLLRIDGNLVSATREASAFLRRALIAPDQAFQEQHRVIETRSVPIDGASEAVRVNLVESPLGAIARLKEKSGAAFLPPEAVAAGERLHADFTKAQLQPRVTMTYEPRLSAKTKGRSGAAVDLSDSALAARLRVGRAMDAVGPELCGVVLDVCGFEKGLERVERERQWPARSAKLMLRTALMALSRHYAPPQKVDRARHLWSADGYRPEASDIGAIAEPVSEPRRRR